MNRCTILTLATLAACAGKATSGDGVKVNTEVGALHDEVDELTSRVEALEASAAPTAPAGWPTRGAVVLNVSKTDCEAWIAANGTPDDPNPYMFIAITAWPAAPLAEYEDNRDRETPSVSFDGPLQIGPDANGAPAWRFRCGTGTNGTQIVAL